MRSRKGVAVRRVLRAFGPKRIDSIETFGPSVSTTRLPWPNFELRARIGRVLLRRGQPGSGFSVFLAKFSKRHFRFHGKKKKKKNDRTFNVRRSVAPFTPAVRLSTRSPVRPRPRSNPAKLGVTDAFYK